jgi:hypothetical protein
VRLPAISTRGNVQIGSGFDYTSSMTPAGEPLVHRLLGAAWQADGIGGIDEVGRRVVLPEQPRPANREKIRLACVGEVDRADAALVLL